MKIEFNFFKWKIGIRKVPPRVDTYEHPFKAFFMDENGNISDTIHQYKERRYTMVRGFKESW